MFITTNDQLITDTFNEDGTLDSIASYWHCALSGDVVFVEDDADLTGITYETVTATDQLQNELNEKCKQFLKDTDWYIVRESETGTATPTHITTLRNKIRGFISS